MESSYFLKKINSKGKLIAGIIIILLCCLFQYLIISHYNSVKDSAKQYEMADKAGEYVYIDVTDYSDYFATYKNDSTTKYYYFLSDGTYLYIGSLKPSEYSKLPKRIYGYTTNMPSDLVKIAKESYNEAYGEDLITDANFYNMFGNYYVDATKAPTDSLIGFTIANVGLFIVGVVLLTVYFINGAKNKKTLSQYSKEALMSDIDRPGTMAIHKAKVYFTEKYVLNYKSKISILYYNDIVWIYPHMYNYRGSTIGSIMIMDRNGKMHSICNMPITNNSKIEFDEYYANLESRLPNSLTGYTAENKQKAREMIGKH